MTLQKLALYVTAEKIVIFNLKRAYHSQFGEVNRRQSPRFRRIQKKTLQTSVFLIKMADEEGFEPPIRVTPYKRFRVARIQPLCHSSVIPPFNIDNCDILQALFKNFYSFFDWLKSFFPCRSLTTADRHLTDKFPRGRKFPFCRRHRRYRFPVLNRALLRVGQSFPCWPHSVISLRAMAITSSAASEVGKRLINGV